MAPSDIIKSYQVGYDREYRTKLPQVVTSEVEEGGDTIMRRVRMTDKETMMRDGYDEHNRRTVTAEIMVIHPRRFYKETEAMTFVKYIRRIAGRTVTDDEMMLLLRTITSGRQYRLTCVIDRTEELTGWNKWVK